MLKGIARVINAYGDNVKDEVFKERLSRISIKELTRTAKERRAGSLGYAEAIVTYYNKRSRFGLSMEKLYTHKNKKNDGDAATETTSEPASDDVADDSSPATQITLDEIAAQNIDTQDAAG